MYNMSQPNTKNGIVLEDNEDFSETLVELLSIRNYSARLFRSSNEALREIDTLNQIGFAVCDWRLPDNTSQNVIDRIIEFHPQAAITVLTGFEDDNLKDFALDKPVRVLRKPVPFEVLMASLEERL